MKLTRLGDLAQAIQAEAGMQGEIEAQIKDLVQRDSLYSRKGRADVIPDAAAEPNRLIAQISAASIEAIEAAIAQLQQMRATLLDHNERVRLEIGALEVANEEAAGSLKAVSGILGQWRANTPVSGEVE